MPENANAISKGSNAPIAALPHTFGPHGSPARSGNFAGIDGCFALTRD